MKKLFLMLAMFLGITVFAVAQDNTDDDDPKEGGGRVYAMLVAYLTKELNLSSEEAQKFWPIYNQYRTEIRKTRVDAKANNAKVIDTDEKLLKIRKRYDGEFAKALSRDKVDKLFKVENQFATALRRELQERRQNNLNRRRLNKQIP
jgi:hypothetical protein